MSMRDYAVDDYGLILDENIAKTILLKLHGEDFCYDEEYGWAYELYDEGICEYIGNFTGEAWMIDDNGINWSGKNYCGEEIAYVQVSSYPSLFRRAYRDIDELVEDFKYRVGEYLPENFDYKNRIYHICGTYYG